MLKFKFLAFKYGLYAFIFAMIGLCAYINDKMIEAIFLFVCYITLRYTFPKTWHSKNFYVCIFFSIISFWIAIPLSLNKNISIFSTVILGALMGYILFKVQDYLDIKAENTNLITNKASLATENTQNNNINVHAMDKVELYHYCRSKGLDEEDCRIAHFIFYERLKGKEFYSAIGYSEAQAKRKRKHILSVLNQI